MRGGAPLRGLLVRFLLGPIFSLEVGALGLLPHSPPPPGLKLEGRPDKQASAQTLSLMPQPSSSARSHGTAGRVCVCRWGR